MRTIISSLLLCGIGCTEIATDPTGVVESEITSVWSSNFSDANGWNTAPYYSTIAYPDLDGDHLADMCGRGVAGIWCGLSNGSTFAGPTLWAPEFSDAAGWTVPQYYSTIHFPDLNNDGKADICGRGVRGLWCAISTGTQFEPATLWTEGFSDAAGWNAPEYYSTIAFPDLNRDGLLDVCGRGAAGVYCGISLGGSFSLPDVWTTMLSDANGWNLHRYFSTIGFPDLNNDHRADICGRGGSGIMCALSTGEGFGRFWVWSAAFDDPNQWYYPQYYSTIGFPDVDGDHRADVCGRGSAGVYCALSNGVSFGPARLWSNLFSNANGGAVESTYKTISYVNFDSDARADLCGRLPGGTVCLPSTGTNFANLQLVSAEQTNLAGFNAESLYSTITFADIDKDGRANVCHRASGGVSCSVP